MKREEKEKIIDQIMELREKNKELITNINGDTSSTEYLLRKAEEAKAAELKELLYKGLDPHNPEHSFYLKNKERLTQDPHYTSWQPEVFDEMRVGSIVHTLVHVDRIVMSKKDEYSQEILFVHDPYRTFVIVVNSGIIHYSDIGELHNKYVMLEYVKVAEKIPSDNPDYSDKTFMYYKDIKIYEE